MIRKNSIEEDHKQILSEDISNPEGKRRPQRKKKKKIKKSEKVSVHTTQESTTPAVIKQIDPSIEFLALLLSPATPFIKRKQLITEYRSLY